MKLTPVKDKLANSIWDSIRLDVVSKTCNPTSDKIYRKIINEMCTPNLESIQDMHQIILNNLQNEINTSK